MTIEAGEGSFLYRQNAFKCRSIISYIFKIEYISDDPHFSHRLVEYVVECSDSEGMRLWLLTIQSNMRPHGMSLSDLAERNRLKIFEHY